MKRPEEAQRVWTPESERSYLEAAVARSLPGNRRTLGAFATWLSTSRGLSPGTITVRLGSASRFVDAMTSRFDAPCARSFRQLTALAIEDFFVDYAKSHGQAGLRSMQAAMRLFLRYASERGWVKADLVRAVPSIRTYRLSHLPRGVSDECLAELFESPWEGRCVGRDRAILYLLCTYGVRRGQISALRLGDIDWHAKTIRFAPHKGGKEVQHGLTRAVAQALAEYLSDERPAVACDSVFLRCRRPHVRLSPSAISALVRNRTELCGLPGLYPHAFRHAFACRLLRAGEPVKMIADVLGHRSLDAVSLYAKVDHARLIEAAVDWPEVIS